MEEQTEPKVHVDGAFSFKELGPLTKEDVAANPEIFVGFHDERGFHIGNCFMVTETTVMFNPLREYAWFDMPLEGMLHLEELTEQQQ